MSNDRDIAHDILKMREREMARFSKRTQRQRGGPDPVAQCISTDLEACHDDSTDENQQADSDESANVGSGRYTVNPKDADLSAGGEFIQAEPNDFPETRPSGSRTDRAGR